MKKHIRYIKQILYTAFLIGSIVLVSFRGGTIAWLLFYFMLMLPVLALLYTLYVYFRFRIVQQVERVVNKGERIPYRLQLANEDFLLMTGIGLNFYTDTVQVMKKASDGTAVPYEKEPERFSLLPHQQREVDLELYCKYRGTYPVGVKSVSVTDFFGLFTITYPMLSQIRLTARPRILTLAQLQSKLQKKDVKKNRTASAAWQELLDFELRKYIPGDSLRRIHWKNSARAGELLVRKQTPQEPNELIVIMNCSHPMQKDDLKRMQCEDNVLEATLALLYDACLKKVKMRVVWCTDGIHEMQIDNAKSFDRFYNLCAELPFDAAMTLEDVWASYEAKMGSNAAFWLIGCNVPSALTSKADVCHRCGKEVVLIDIGEDAL